MKKVIIILLLSLFFLTGCWTYNLGSFTAPNDIQFLECIAELDTVSKIAQYMEDNFTYREHYLAYTPYQMWYKGIGDCNDYGAFGVFAARYNGIEAYQVLIDYYSNSGRHMIGVYKIDDYWGLTDCWAYHERFKIIDEAIKWHSIYSERVLKSYNIIERGKQK